MRLATDKEKKGLAMAEDSFYDSLSDATLEKIAAGGDPYDSMTDQELEMVASGSWRNAAQPAAPQSAPRPQYTDEQRAFEQARRRRNATAKPSEEMGSPFWAGVEGALVEAPIAAAKGAVSAVKQGVEGLVVSPATGIVRLAGTPVRMLTGWDGLHRLADNIDEGYRNWGADALDQGYEDWGMALGDWGSKVTGVAGSVGGLALGGGAAKVASKLGNAGKYVAAAGKAYHAAMPWMFGNNAAVRTYDSAIRSAEERGESPNKAKALGLAAVNGAIHFLGFKLFENQSLNKMLGMPQTLEASMPAWANAAKDAGASTFSGLASGVRNGMFKYILAERAKGALKAGGIMGLQNFLSSIPQQVAEGGDVDWGRAAQEGLSGIGEGALMEGLMGGAAAWRSPKAARDFIADVYFRRGYKLPNGEVVPGLLHTPEGREFVMKQNPEAQSRILDIVEHGGEVTPAELDAACLPPMDKAELKKFVKDWKHDLEVKRWRSDEGEFLGDGEELTGSDDVRSQNAASNEQRAVDEAWNADMPRDEAPPARSAGAGRDVLPAADAEAQQRQINDAAERNAAQRRARSADEELALFNEYNDAYRKGEIDMSFDEWLAQRAEAAPEAPESRGAPEVDNVPPEAPSAPEAVESRPAEAAPVVEPPVIERANRLRRNLKPNFRHEGAPDNRLRPQSKENVNETGNRPDEAQSQPPVQDAGRGGEAGAPPPEPRPSGGAPSQGAAKAEAQRAGAVESQPAAEPPKNAPASAPRAEGTTTPPKTENAPQGGKSTVGAKPAAKPTAARSVSPVSTGEETKKPAFKRGDRVFIKGAKDGQRVTFLKANTDGTADVQVRTPGANRYAPEKVETRTVPMGDVSGTNMRGALTSSEQNALANGMRDEQELREDLDRGNYVVQDAAPQPPPKLQPNIPKTKKTSVQVPKRPVQAPVQTEKQAQKTSVQAKQVAQENRPESVQAVQTVQATAQEPAQDAQATTGKTPPSRTVRGNLVDRRLRPLIDVAKNADGTFSPDALRNHDGNGGLGLKDLRLLHDFPEIVDDLGLPRKQAAALRRAIEEAYVTQSVSTPNSRENKDSEAGTYNYSVAASNAIRNMKSRPNDVAALAEAQWKVQRALEDAQRARQEAGKSEKELREKYFEGELAKIDERVAKLDDANARAFNRAIQDLELQPSLESRRESGGTALNVAEREGSRAGEDGVYEVDPTEAYDNERTGEGGAALDLAKRGGRRFRGYAIEVKGVEGNEVELAYYDAGGNLIRRPNGELTEKVSLDKLRERAKTIPSLNEIVKAVERSGEDAEGASVRFAKAPVSDFPQGVPAKWSAAAKKSVEGAWRVARNFIPGAKVEFADRLPDGDGAELKNDRGVVVGKWDRAGNRVTLLPGADASTVAHELGWHGAWQFAEQEARAGRGTLLERMKAIADGAPQSVKDAIDARYKGRPPEELREEYGAELMGRRGGEAIRDAIRTLEGRAWYNRAWQTIKDAIRGMMARMGFNRADLSQIDGMTPDETMDWLVKQMTEGKTLGRVERGGAEMARGADVPAAREARAPAAAGTPIMDEKRTFDEKAREAVLDSDAPFRDVQDEVGGVKEVVRADGYTDHRMIYDVKRDAKGRPVDRQGRSLDAKNRVLDAAGNVVKDKAGHDVYSEPAPDYSKAPLKEGSTDFVAAKDKYNGRLEYESRDLQRRVDAVKADLNAARLDTQKSKKGSDELLKDFNLFLAAEHAAERNRTHALEHGEKPDPDYYHGMGKVVWGGVEVGFSEHVADMIRNDLRAKYGAKFSHFEDAAQKAYKIAADELKRRLDGDLLSQADYDYYHDRVASGEWKHYVPLKTDRARLGIDDGDIPLGTKLHRNEYRKASGRGETVAELAPYTDLVLQAEQGIKKALRNELANVEANFIEHATNVRGFKDANGNSLIAEIVPGDDIATHGKNYKFVFKDGSSVVSEGSSRLAGNHPEIHLFKRGGRLYAIRYVKGKYGRGLDVAKAASGDNVESWGNGVLSNVPKFTGWMSAMRTQYSPEFTVSNWLADSLEAAQALVGRYGAWDGAAAFGKAVAAEVRNAKDVWRYLRRGELRGDVKKAVEAGLLTKGGVASEGFEGKEASIRDRLDEFRRQSEGFWRLKNPVDKAKWVAEHVKEYLGMANEFMEYSTRIGLFSALHNKGVPVQDAVRFARDATVNFNRKGTLMPLINGLYMFANASVQGAARAVQAGKESFQSLPDDGSGWGRHKVKGDLVALLVAVGAAQAVMDHFLGNDEEREKAGGKNARNRSEYDKKHNVGIPLPGGYNMPIMRFRGPYAAIPYLAQTATNVALGDAKPEDAAWALARETTDQFTDLVGGNGVFNDKNEVDGSLLAQSIAPSAVDPVIQLMSGKDYKGEERLRRSFDKNAPVSWNGRRNTSEAYKKTAQMLNWLTGGNSLRKGKIDIAPEDAQLVWEFIWGGLGRDISNFASTLQNISQAAAGGKPESLWQDIPLGRRLFREYPESTGRYYDALDEYERDKTEYRKTTEMKRKAALRRARPYLTQSGNGRVDVLVSEIKNLQHLERGEVLVGQKWVEPKTPRSEAQKEKYRERRLRLQAQVLKILGE